MTEGITRHLTVNGCRYAYVEEGKGPLVLFGHGVLAHKEMFRAQIDALRDRYRCVSIDWPGHGGSGYRSAGWTLWDLAEDAAGLVGELGERAAIFVGLSQGGMAFMRLALRHPDIVRALILLDTSAGPENPDVLPVYRQLQAMLTGDDEVARSQACDAGQQVLYGAPWRERNPAEVAREKELVLSLDRTGIGLALDAVFSRDDVTERLSEIEAPTLVIVGEQDVATPPERAKEIAGAITSARLAVIPEAGHHSPLEAPASVTAAIEEFLAGLTGG